MLGFNGDWHMGLLNRPVPPGPVSEMTYTVSSGTLNSTILYHTIPYHTCASRDETSPSPAMDYGALY